MDKSDVIVSNTSFMLKERGDTQFTILQAVRFVELALPLEYLLVW